MIDYKKLENATVLVTGGAGFIGSHLCDELLSQGAKVIALDNLFTGVVENLREAQKNKNFIFIEGDANKKDVLVKIFRDHAIDYVFHYAAILGVKRVLEQPLLVLDDLEGLRYILELSREYKVKKVVFASSSEAYGHTAELPLIEDNNGKDLANQNEHTHLYALVKIMGEKMMKIYNDMYSVPTCSLRFFNVFGPRQESSAYGFVVGIFMKQVIQDKNPTIFGDGYQTRDFIYIKDNVRLGVKALLSDESNGHVINVGVGRQTTIRDLAERIIRISGKNLKLEFLPERKYEIRYRSPDVTKMRKILGEEIEDKFDENLKETYKGYLQGVE